MRWPLLLLLLLVHAMLFVTLSDRHHQTLRQLASLELRIVPPEPDKPVRPKAPDRIAPDQHRAHTVPVPEVQVTTTPPAVTAAAVPALPASAASAPQRLNLALPLRMQGTGPTAKELTSNDLHAGQPNKKSIEYRIADAAGTLPVEVLTTTDGLGSTMVRQGTKCTKIVANRLSTIDPFDPRAKLPPTSSDCFKK